MRTVGRANAQVGLLLFDEPSASLDPIAEHGMERLRNVLRIFVLMQVQIYLIACASFAGARRWCSRRTASESSHDTLTSFCEFQKF